MRATLDIPDDLANEVRRRAKADGRELAEAVIDLLRKGLNMPSNAPPVISTDPVTGLPVIHSPPDAPISRLSTEQVLEAMRKADEEDDLERFARSVRH